METLKITGARHKAILVKDDVVKIIDLGGVFSSMRKEKVLSVYDITGVEVKKPDLYKGYIQLQVAGQASPNSSGLSSRRKSTFAALEDENAVLFDGEENYQVALAMQNHIRAMNAKAKAPSGAPALSAADELLKFKKLLDEGVITQEEFEAQKKKLL